MLKEQTFDTSDLKINYAEGPDSGDPLVMLHGGGERWQEFLPIIPTLADNWHVFALDLRGHGRSDRAAGNYRPEHYAADVVAFTEGLIAEPAVFFGQSLGGWIALLVAAQLQDKSRALILGDPPLNLERFLEFEGSEERKSMWRAFEHLGRSSLSISELASALADQFGMSQADCLGWAETLSQVDPDAVLYHAEGRLDEYVAHIDLGGALQRLTCPTLLLQGDPLKGGFLTDEDVEQVLGLLADGTHVRLEGVGHGLGLGTGEVAHLLKAVTDFLESV
jgi:pimeloyl-ACP methyl ester carboxylesterase